MSKLRVFERNKDFFYKLLKPRLQMTSLLSINISLCPCDALVCTVGIGFEEKKLPKCFDPNRAVLFACA